ncbi:hypothetical protein Nepgr_022969 [Nepenthes gracilis]|uniref:Uncharacterized protein n=1 Tax=Nepenthes gracilis TaxID=150966 RepID=A0AAD3T1T9_NEPGR|nr:hypothetical protein Nepgr_022969 [Nepenthes gracilis]
MLSADLDAADVGIWCLLSGWLMSWPMLLLYWESAGRFSRAFHEPGLDRQLSLVRKRISCCWHLECHFFGLSIVAS